jgi:hypothetical protein
MDDAPYLKVALKAYISVSPQGTAETFLARRDIEQGGFQIDAIRRAALPEQVPDATEERRLQEERDRKQSLDDEARKQQMDADKHEPDMDIDRMPDEVDAPHPQRKNSSVFREYVLGDTLVTLIDAMDTDKFQTMMSDATSRVDKYCEFHVRPSAPTAWSRALSHTLLPRSATAASRAMFFVNMNAAGPVPENATSATMKQQKYPEEDFKGILSALFGDKKEPDTQGFFGMRGSADMLVVTDGRNFKTHTKARGHHSAPNPRSRGPPRGPPIREAPMPDPAVPHRARAFGAAGGPKVCSAIRKATTADSVHKFRPVLGFRLSYSNLEFARKDNPHLGLLNPSRARPPLAGFV